MKITPKVIAPIAISSLKIKLALLIKEIFISVVNSSTSFGKLIAAKASFAICDASASQKIMLPDAIISKTAYKIAN